MRGATDNKGRISITAGTGAVVSVSHVSGKTLELVAHVEGGTKLEMRQAKDGRRALILRATGATALITEREPWVQELAKPTGAEIWKAGAYDVMRSTDGGFIEFAIPEDQRSLLIVPLRPTPG